MFCIRHGVDLFRLEAFWLLGLLLGSIGRTAYVMLVYGYPDGGNRASASGEYILRGWFGLHGALWDLISVSATVRETTMHVDGTGEAYRVLEGGIAKASSCLLFWIQD
jgi:hypothetical protein